VNDVGSVRTVQVKDRHIMLPFILNSGGDSLLGEVAFRALLDAGARRGTSTTAEDVVVGVEMLLPKPDPGGMWIESRFDPDVLFSDICVLRTLKKVPRGHFLDNPPDDIRNNLIGGAYAGIIIHCFICAERVREGKISRESLSYSGPGMAAEIELQLNSCSRREETSGNRLLPDVGSTWEAELPPPKD
jgi:hypothetical protein